MAGTRMEIRPMDGPVGAEITGVDLSQPLDSETFKRIDDTLNDRGVIFFRNQRLTPEQHIRFSERFGEIEIPVNAQYRLPGYPQIYVVSNIIENGRPIGNADAGRVWHHDSSYMKVPSRGSLLYAREVPHDDAGNPLGDTLFASMTAAYDELPADVKRRVDGLVAVHNYTQQYERRRARILAEGGQREAMDDRFRSSVPDVTHPVIRAHPITGRRCIFVNQAFVIGIEGMPDEEALALRDYLVEHSTQPRFVYRHRWRVGDLLMWDNCLTQHLAVADYALPRRRLMHRTTIKGLA